MSDLTTSGTAADLGLTNRICGEIILMDISLLSYVRIKSLNPLSLRKRSKGTYVTDLGLSSGEHCGSVNSGDDINLSGKRSDLSDLTAVGSLVILEDHLPYGLLLILIYSLSENCKILFVLSECSLKTLGDLSDIAFPCLLVIGEDCGLHLCGRNDLLHLLEHLSRNST